MGNAKDFIPALKYGHKILPSDLAGILGLPTVGEIFYVDANAGSDTANSGKSQDDAYATVAKAYSMATSGKHDVVLISPTGGTGRTTEASAITWAKRFTHLIGSAAPAQVNPRAGMSFSDLSGDNCFTVTEQGCIFKNITIATFANNNVLVDVQGDRNYFGNVHFAGMGIQAAADDAAGRNLLITAAEENVFEGCTIGLDTVTRGAANASLELTGSCPRNIFRNCVFPIFTDAATPLFVKADTGNCYERFLVFENCMFLNADLGSSTVMTIGMDLSTTGNGVVLLRSCVVKGITDWANNYDNLYVDMPAVDTANQGFAIIAAT